MSEAPNAIALVLDPEFGEKLNALVHQMPTWAADTPPNRLAAEAVWQTPATPPGHELTTFIVQPKETAEQSFVRVMPTIDLHHNALAQDPPYGALLVIGVAPSPVVRDVLERFALHVTDITPEGFRAERAG